MTTTPNLYLIHSRGKMGQYILDAHIAHIDNVSVQSWPSSGIAYNIRDICITPVAIALFANGEIYTCNCKEQHFQMTM